MKYAQLECPTVYPVTIGINKRTNKAYPNVPLPLKHEKRSHRQEAPFFLHIQKIKIDRFVQTYYG
jgi:hypothetical protein